jgi:hypothetical protein
MNTEDEIDAAFAQFGPTPLWRVMWWRIRDAMPWSPTPAERWERAIARLRAEVDEDDKAQSAHPKQG